MKQALSILITFSLIFLNGCAARKLNTSSELETTDQHWVVNQHENYTVSATNKAIRGNGYEVIALLENYIDGRQSVRLTENLGECVVNKPVTQRNESIILVGDEYIKAIHNNTCIDGELYGEYFFHSGFSKVEDKKLTIITKALFNGLEIAGVKFDPTGKKQVIAAFTKSNQILNSVNLT